MSDSQQRGKKPAKKRVYEEKATTLDEIFGDPEPEQVKRPDSELSKPAEKKATVKEPVIVCHVEKLLVWAARLKTGGSFGQWGNGANFANHMVRDSFTVGGKEITIEKASELINEHTSRRP
jgi:hypothetical protein